MLSTALSKLFYVVTLSPRPHTSTSTTYTLLTSNVYRRPTCIPLKGSCGFRTTSYELVADAFASGDLTAKTDPCIGGLSRTAYRVPAAAAWEAIVRRQTSSSIVDIRKKGRRQNGTLVIPRVALLAGCASCDSHHYDFCTATHCYAHLLAVTCCCGTRGVHALGGCGPKWASLRR